MQANQYFRGPRSNGLRTKSITGRHYKVLMTALAVMPFTGCGGGSASRADNANGKVPTVSVADAYTVRNDASTTGSSALDEAAQTFDECLSEKGVEALPTNAAPAAVEAALNDPAVVSAMNACAPLLGAAADDIEVGADERALSIDSSASFAACARGVLGIDIPDDILLLDSDDPRSLAIDNIEPTPDQERELVQCMDEAIATE